MSVSRVDKMIRETTGEASLAAATARRAIGVEVVVPDDDERWKTMVQTAVALGLRCLTGPVWIRRASGAPGPVLMEAAMVEAAGYEALDRLRPMGPGMPTMTLGVGVADCEVNVHAEGFELGINAALPRASFIFAPAAVFAVCCGFAKLFAARVLGRSRTFAEQWSLSLATLEATRGSHPPPPSSIDLGRLLLIGGGAIGSGFAFVLKRAGWTADLTIVDDDHYSEPNEETTMLIAPEDAIRLRPKAKTLAALASDGTLTSNGIQMRVGPGQEPSWGDVAAVVCAVDNPETRRFLDRAVPHTLLMNAGVGGTAAEAGHVLMTRHTRNDLPLAHWYPDLGGTVGPPVALPAPPTEVGDDDCSRLVYDNASLAAPFLGLAAGSLLAANLGLRAAGIVQPAQYLKFDMLKLQGVSVRRP